MTEVVRGTIADRPWGLTFGQFGLRQVTGTLSVQSLDGREYKVAFDQGAIVGAVSPQTSDSATRVALTSNLIIAPQVANLQKQILARPTEDDVDVVIDVCKLDAMRSLKLRRKLTAQRAARIFSIENGSFVLDDQISISTSYDASVDVRAVIYQGARLNFSETRLVTELRDLGSHFVLGEHALETFDWFGFEDADRPILDALQPGATIAEIEAKHRDIDPRQVQSVVYALVSYRQAHSVGDSGPARKISRPGVAVSFKQPATAGNIVEVDRRPRAPTGEPAVAIEPSPTPAPMAVSPKGSAPHPAIQDPPRPTARASTSPPVAGRAQTSPFTARPQTTPPVTARVHTPPSTARTPTPVAPLPAPRLPAMTPKARVPVQDESTPMIGARTTTLKGGTPVGRPPTETTGLPGIEEEPTASRNLVGVDRGPPPMPELASPRTVTAPIGARSSFGSPPPIGPPSIGSSHSGSFPIGSSEEPTGRRAELPRAASAGPRAPSHGSDAQRLKAPSAPPSSPLLRPKTPSPDPAASGSMSVPRTISARTRTPSPAPSNIALARTISQSSGVPPTPDYSEGSDRVRQSIDEAAQAFARGREALDAGQPEVALAELSRAATLNPHEFAYTSFQAYAQFLCATGPERIKSADKVRKMLTHTIQKSTEPETARFYLARMERLLDRKKEAVALLQQVVKAIPNHPGATAELQDIEDKAVEKAGLGGLFGRKKDKS